MGKKDAETVSPSTFRFLVTFFWDEYGPTVATFVATLVFIFGCVGGGLFGLAYYADRAGCSNLHAATGLPTKYRVTTCYVQVNGQWVPRDNWRGVSDGR